MNIQQALGEAISGRDLKREDMQSVMQAIMTGEATAAQIAGFLVALRMKGETVDELTAAASVMRELATPVELPHAIQAGLVDTCGTGGDGSRLFNVSIRIIICFISNYYDIIFFCLFDNPISIFCV